MQPFAPRPAGTVNIAVSAASQRVATNTGNAIGQIRVFNGATETIFVTFGDATVTADAATGTPIPSGAIEVMTVMAATHVAAIGTGATGTIYFTPGVGI